MKGVFNMGSAHAMEMELKAEQELEEALDDKNLSSEERAVIEEQLRIIRNKYEDMVQALYV